ncbi:hypothetical protein GCM10022384_35940 [Streptomyces marokkonensis]|uniref:Uncharacterized protein n=1 Tax=Streptomyces marokkonensis TaxID=324855 RepID=A0ABP7QKR3_9ACTN
MVRGEPDGRAGDGHIDDRYIGDGYIDGDYIADGRFRHVRPSLPVLNASVRRSVRTGV